MKLLLICSAFALFGCLNGQETAASVDELATPTTEGRTEGVIATVIAENTSTENTTAVCSACTTIVEELSPKISNVRETKSFELVNVKKKSHLFGLAMRVR